MRTLRTVNDIEREYQLDMNILGNLVFFEWDEVYREPVQQVFIACIIQTYTHRHSLTHAYAHSEWMKIKRWRRRRRRYWWWWWWWRGHLRHGSPLIYCRCCFCCCLCCCCSLVTFVSFPFFPLHTNRINFNAIFCVRYGKEDEWWTIQMVAAVAKQQ